jgi:hypothetical protein
MREENDTERLGWQPEVAMEPRVPDRHLHRERLLRCLMS